MNSKDKDKDNVLNVNNIEDNIIQISDDSELPRIIFDSSEENYESLDQIINQNYPDNNIHNFGLFTQGLANLCSNLDLAINSKFGFKYNTDKDCKKK